MDKFTNQDLYFFMFMEKKDEYDFNHLDYYFADFLMKGERVDKKAFFFLMYLSMKIRAGDICIDIEEMKKYGLNDIPEYLSGFGFAGSQKDNRPVVLDSGRIYLNRFYRYETFLAEWIVEKSGYSNSFLLDHNQKFEKLKKLLSLYFDCQDEGVDWQKFAVLTAIFFNFALISGGPGTGKTTTIAKLFLILNEIYDEPPKIKLCAPTGKAASRLTDAINGIMGRMSGGKEVNIENASTIHRLLKFNPETNTFFYNRKNKLKADIIIVDEASMIDLKLMSHLAEAVPYECRVVLLGDRYQLASVSPGSVFADICGKEINRKYSDEVIALFQPFFNFPIPENLKNEKGKGLGDSVVELQKNYRFKDESSIAKLSQAIKNDRIEECMDLIEKKSDDLEFVEISGRMEFESIVEDIAEKYISGLLSINTPNEGFGKISEFSILSPVKEGFFGVDNINSMVEKFLFTKQGFTGNKSWYNGKPVIVSKNDYRENLFNGDIGITIFENNIPSVFFEDGESGYRAVNPVRLSSFSPFYSTTVHKSQGSEFGEVFIIIPENFNRVLTKELIYTAVTRARKKVTFIGSKKNFKLSISRKTERKSGLSHRLGQAFQ